MGTANIVFGHVGAGQNKDNAPLLSPTASENIATNNATAVTSVNAAPSRRDSRELAVRIVIDEDAYVTVDGTTAAIGKVLVKANVETFLAVMPGAQVSIIDAA